MANWYKELQEIHATHGIIGIAYKGQLHPSIEAIQKEIDYDFDAGYGAEEGFAFTAWTADRVYFPACYDGSEWITWVPRNPCNEDTSHIGGG
jgi:hypothetical protein